MPLCTARNPCFYSATNEAELDAAMNTILSKVISGGEFATETVCDDSCLANGCEPGQICITDELSPDRPRCQPDPCQAMGACGDGMFCRAGKCVAACTTKCAAGTRCVVPAASHELPESLFLIPDHWSQSEPGGA